MTYAFLLFMAFGPVPGRAVEPGWAYRVLRGPHFEIIFREDRSVSQRALAHRYLRAAEQAYLTLQPVFGEAPANVPIVLSDDTDSANALAEMLPYPRITVYPVLPSRLDTIDDYGDWPFELLAHEYAHILNMWPAHGFYRPLGWIFGGVVRPNAVLPTWYLEGLAVGVESVYSGHGRLRSAETRASARAMAMAGRAHDETLARINESSLSTWPYGDRPYLYGGWWWQAALEAPAGPAAIGLLNDDFSRRLPFLLNGPVRGRLGLGAGEFFTRAMERQKTRAAAELARLAPAAAGAPPARDLSDGRGQVLTFALSPSGNRLAYFAGGTLHDPGTRVYLKERASPGQDFAKIPARPLFRSTPSTRLAWRDEDRFVYDALDLRAPYVEYRDLYQFDLTTGRRARLTRGRRAEQAAVSPGGGHVVFVENDAGLNHLARLELVDGGGGGRVTRLLDGAATGRLGSPEFTDSGKIVYVSRRRDGRETIEIFDPATKAIAPAYPRLRAAQGLRRVRGGFLATDAGSGARNAFDLRGDRPFALTATLTHVKNVDLDEAANEVVYTELGPDGYRLRAAGIAERRPAQLPPADVPRFAAAAAPAIATTEKSYQPFEYLRPRYWIPFVYQSENGLVLQGLSENQDPLGRNAYSLAASYDTGIRRTSYGGSFTNRSLPTEISVSAAKSAIYLAADASIRENETVSLSLGEYRPANDRLNRFYLGGTWAETASSALSYRRAGPFAAYDFAGLGDPVHHAYGLSFGVRHTEYLPERGNLAYGRTEAQIGQRLDTGGGSRLSLTARGLFEPKLAFANVLALGDPSVGGNYAVNLTQSNMLLRGYPSGQFLGRKILNANLEFALPIKAIDRGWGTFPLFLHNLDVVLFGDVLSVDGAGLDPALNEYFVRRLSQFEPGTGLELRLSTDASYHLPLMITLGLYSGLDKRFGGQIAPFFGVSLGQLPGLRVKTP